MSAVERGARLVATLTGRTYRVLSVNAETDTARVLVPRDGEFGASVPRSIGFTTTSPLIASR